MSVNHYENFPVASWLCPRALRPPIAAIYWFARTADDLADEGDASPAQRLADLAAYREDLSAVFSGASPSPRWAAVFEPLTRAIAQFQLPQPLLEDLLSAFAQDVTHPGYADRAELLDYCRRSANPVGRLLLHLYGVDQERALRQSDAICTALQLANFWQDLGVDLSRGRNYLPRSDCARHGVAIEALRLRDDSAAARALIADLVGWAHALMVEGAPLVHALPGRAGWELRLVVQGGLRVLDKIEQLHFATLRSRPVLRWQDAPVMLWRALGMRATLAGAAA
ncbi:MAG TPA: squalene synthase HpnC [Albitalea sp.]|nr:squalene synthase HpnC [Albitalea sp.]